jgi:hypothetical protein
MFFSSCMMTGITIYAEDAQRNVWNSSSRVRMVRDFFRAIFMHSQRILVKSPIQISELILSLKTSEHRYNNVYQECERTQKMRCVYWPVPFHEAQEAEVRSCFLRIWKHKRARIFQSIYWLENGLDDQRIGSRFLAKTDNFPFTIRSRPVLGPIQPPVQKY